jgi:hypothetical protein
VRNADKEGIREIADNLDNKNQKIRSDCLNVLYEIGYTRPGLIAPYADKFLELLDDRNNRVVWGGMIALANLAESNSRPIWDKVDSVIKAIDNGTIITLVWGIRTLARVAAGNTSRMRYVLPKLQKHLQTCSPRDVPTHLEGMLPIINQANWKSLSRIVKSRMKEMSTSHVSRLKKVLKEIPWALE